jgi:uncharacterized membrane protein YvbJ
MAKFCGNCGAKMDDTVKVCGMCGYRFPMQKQTAPLRQRYLQKLRA